MIILLSGFSQWFSCYLIVIDGISSFSVMVCFDEAAQGGGSNILIMGFSLVEEKVCVTVPGR